MLQKEDGRAHPEASPLRSQPYNGSGIKWGLSGAQEGGEKGVETEKERRQRRAEGERRKKKGKRQVRNTWVGTRKR